MDPIVVAPQARGCCLTRGSITIWTVLAANCVFFFFLSWASVHVCVLFSLSECVFFLSLSLARCKCTYVLTPRPPRHIAMATALFSVGPRVTRHRLTPPHGRAISGPSHELICKLVVSPVPAYRHRPPRPAGYLHVGSSVRARERDSGWNGAG